MRIKGKWKRAEALVLAVLLCFSGVLDSGITQTKASVKPEKYAVTVEACKNGSVELGAQRSSASFYAAGETVRIYARPDPGYRLEKLAVADKKGKAVDLKRTGDSAVFSMPDVHVAVTAVFTETGKDFSSGGMDEKARADLDKTRTDAGKRAAADNGKAVPHENGTSGSKEGTTSDKRDAADDKEEAASDENGTAGGKEGTTSDKRDAAGDKEEAASDGKVTADGKERVASSERDAAGDKEKTVSDKGGTAAEKKETVLDKAGTEMDKNAAESGGDAPENGKAAAESGGDVPENGKDVLLRGADSADEGNVNDGEEIPAIEEEIQQAITNHMDILEPLEEGETASLQMFSSRASGEEIEIQVTAKDLYSYADYGLGTWGTRQWQVAFEDPDTGEKRTVYTYCIQPKKNRPGDCTARLVKLSDKKLISKVIWAGNSTYSGENSFWNCARQYGWMSDSHWECAYEYGWADGPDGGAEWIITHLAASKVNGDADWDYGANNSARKLAQDLIDFASDKECAVDYPEISFSRNDVTARIAEPGDWDMRDGNITFPEEVEACGKLVQSGAYQKTPAIRVSGSRNNTVTFTAPKNIYCFEIEEGCYCDTADFEVLADGRIKYTVRANAEICFIAPLDQAEKVSATFRFTARGAVKKDFTPYKLVIDGPEDYQNLCMVLGIAAPDDVREASMTVRWITAGDLHIEKEDSHDRERLAGVTFNLLDTDGKVVVPTKNNGIKGDINDAGLITVREDGCADLENIPAGIYSLRELYVPVGYRIPPRDGVVKILQGRRTDLTVKNDQVAAGIQIQKYDADTGKPIPQGGGTFENARFRIVALHECKIGRIRYQPEQVVYDDLTLDKNGYAATPADALTEGRYRLEETGAPTGYLIGGSVEFAIEKSDHGKLKGITGGEIKEPPVRGGVKIKKVDKETKKAKPQGSASLEGARFEIISLNESPVNVEGKEYGSGQAVCTLVIGADGQAVTEPRLLPYGRYAVREASGGQPTGYLWNGENHREFSIVQDGKTVDLCGSPMEDPVIRGGVKIKKVDKETKKAKPQGSASLEGARFEIISLNENPVNVEGKEYGSGQAVCTLVIGADGQAVTEPRLLPYGRYAVREASGGQPTGYLWDGENYREFSIAQDGKTVDLCGSPMEDPVIRGGVKIKKVDKETKKAKPQGNASLEGARFEIISLNENPVNVEGKEYGSGQAVCTLVIGADGQAVTGPRLLPYGRYAVREASGGQPTGYLWDGENYREFSIAQDGKTVDLCGSPMEDPVIRGGIKVSKYDGESGEGRPLGGASLKNMEIAIYNESREEVYVSGQIYRPGEIVHVMYTDADGCAETSADLLPYGSYRLVETAPPEGYMDPSEDDRGVYEQTFTIDRPGEIVDRSGWQKGVIDYVERGDLSIRKIDSDTQRSMAGVAFRITSETTEESHVFVTDANGYYSTSSSYTPHTRNTNGGKLRDGIWFGLREDGENVKADDSLGALPYDSYRIEELPGENNKGRVMFSDIVTISENGETVMLGAVENKEIAMGTTAKDSLTGSHYQAADAGACIVDTVFYQNLDKGVSYVLKGTLVDKFTGEAVKDADGNVIAAEKTFRPAIGTGSVDVEFVFDASGFAGMAVVVFEELYEGETKLAEHKDIGDEEQTIYYPGIGTQAADRETSANVSHADSDVTIVDTVSYTGLQAGRTYRLTGTLMVKETGEAYVDADGRTVTASRIFVPEASSGTVEVLFTFNGVNASGKTLVAFEELFRGGQTYAVHTDINDEGQSVYFPSITTEACVENTGEKMAMAGTPLAVTDTVSYNNLKAGQEYRLSGSLMVKETGEILRENGIPVTAEKSFIPDAPSGVVDVRFVLNAEGLAGNSIVVFEELYIGSVPVASHRDIEDGSQTVYIPEIHTTAVDGITKTHEAKAAGVMTVIDTVTYRNLMPGKTYTVAGTLMDKATGEAVRAEGKEVTAETEFEPQEREGAIDVTFLFDGMSLAGKTVVVFETLLYNGTEVACHKDIRDEEQSVQIIPAASVKGALVEKEKEKATAKSSLKKVGISGERIDRKRYVGRTRIAGKTKTVDGVKTGDTGNILLWGIIGLFSLGLFVVLLLAKKKIHK